MAKTNAYLIHYQGGWTEVVDGASVAANGRREGLLDIDVGDEGTARAIGFRVLVDLAGDRSQITVKIEPSGLADTPFFGWNLGDTIPVDGEFSGSVSERVLALGVTGADEGPEYTTQMRDIVLEADDRIHRWLKIIGHGASAGMSTAPTPPPDVPSPDLGSAPPRSIIFTGPSPLVAGSSRLWRADVPTDLREFDVLLQAAGSGATEVQLIAVDQFGTITVVPNSTVSLAAGELHGHAYVTLLVEPGAQVGVLILTVGAGADGLVAQARVSSRT